MGYNDSYDEWREVGDIVSESGNPHGDTQTPQHQIQPYSLYKELSIKIKQLLTCGKKQSQLVKFNMKFDYLLFVDGLQATGIAKTFIHGNTWYKIQAYND